MNKEQVKEQIEDIITYVEEAGLDFCEKRSMRLKAIK